MKNHVLPFIAFYTLALVLISGCPRDTNATPYDRDAPDGGEDYGTGCRRSEGGGCKGGEV